MPILSRPSLLILAAAPAPAKPNPKAARAAKAALALVDQFVIPAYRNLAQTAEAQEKTWAAFAAIAARLLIVTIAAGKAKLLANATVKSLTGTMLTVTADGKDTSLAVDAKTSVIGKGVGTKSRAKGGKTAITDLLSVGDRVSVTYQEDGTAMHATKVQLIAKAK